MGNKILITGGAGFIGSHLARALVTSGYEVRVLDDLSTGKRERIAALDGIELLQGDVRNPAAVQRAMQGVQAVVHLAGVQPGVDPIRAQDVNLGGALHILNTAREMGGNGVTQPARVRVVLCGSASVYGKQSGFVLHEELAPRPMTPEAVMALAMEQYGRVYRESFNVPVVNLRIFRVFGPDEDAERPDAGLVAKLIRAALEGKAPVLLGDGQQTRDFIHVDNVVAAIVAALLVEDPPAEPLNIASGESIAINFLWNLVLECAGKKRLAIDPTYVPAPPWEAKHSRPQIARACKVLGWAPAVRLREGLQKTVDHYIGEREQDPNAWFAPKEEPSARKKMTFPQVSVPQRRFGSVVTPAFGTPIGGHSQAAPLPSHSQAAIRPFGGHSQATPLPRQQHSQATPLPRQHSQATPLPKPLTTPTPARGVSLTPSTPVAATTAKPAPTPAKPPAPTMSRGEALKAKAAAKSPDTLPAPPIGKTAVKATRPPSLNGAFAQALATSTATVAAHKSSANGHSTLPARTSLFSETDAASAHTPPPPPLAAAKPVAEEDVVEELGDSDVVAAPDLKTAAPDDDSETRIDADLNFEWAPVPSLPGMGR